jgi:hypothetical protein
MTDRELMQMALDALDWKLTTLLKKSWENHHIHEVVKALRDRLAQPEYEFECPRCGHCCQQRDWVGLTDEEGAEMWADAHDIDGKMWMKPKELFRDIEAKLKEKNS